ncbi:uncharacterized protein LOC117169731 [Belonocnema kinseyi]|uniref:uncharacterized protein LOC117169731 n=1 Tax=Belonocnema kinseyi TaxID=2817044 RepID=UPI00143DE1E5|nr:uncharacterized protein LOC117169731 [Belonocnema kinseyi]
MLVLIINTIIYHNKKKFFGTVRQAAGSNEHTTCPTFLELYRLLSVYSALKPPAHGNCTVTEEKFEFVITVADIKNLYKKTESKSTKTLRVLKSILDKIMLEKDWEVEQVIEHDASLSPILDCIIYYVTGYLCKQILKRDNIMNVLCVPMHLRSTIITIQ